jgi:uncharacterized protein DUF664
VDEKETLVAFLDFLREAVVHKVGRLDAPLARRSLVPSGTSLLGLAKHLTLVEVFWLPYLFAGLDVVIPSGDLAPTDDVESVIDGYRAACAQSNRIIAEGGVEDLGARPYESRAMTLRWILVHMVEETARHAGHADILREQLDGTTGL